MNEIRTLVMTRRQGEKFLLKIEDQIILDLLIVSIDRGQVTLSFRVSDEIKISTIKDLIIKKIQKN